MKQIKKRSALAVGVVALGLLLSASTVLAENVIVNDQGYVTKIENLKVFDDFVGSTPKDDTTFIMIEPNLSQTEAVNAR